MNNDIIEFLSVVEDWKDVDSRVIELRNTSDSMYNRIQVYFANGYGASVVQKISIHGDNLFEIAVLNKKGTLVYTTGITSDVVGNLDLSDAIRVTYEISELPNSIWGISSQ